MNKDNHIFLTATGLFLGAFLLAWYFINEGLFHVDSVILARAVEESYRTGHLHAAVSGRYGIVLINAILYWPFYLRGQNADFLTRFSSVFFYALSIPAFFIFINDLFKNRVQAFFAAVLLALTPFYLVPNTFGKEHGMSMFFFLCSMVLINRGGDEKRPATVLLAGLCYMAALSVRESMLFMLPFYFWLYFKPAVAFRPLRVYAQKERLNAGLLAFLVLPLVIIFSLMMTAYLGAIMQRSLTGDELSVPHFFGIFSKILWSALMDLKASFPLGFFCLGTMGILVLGVERRYFLLLFFLAWACVILVYGNFDGYVPRHLDMVIIGVHAFVSYFLAWLYRRFRVPATGIFALLITMQLIYVYPMLEFRRHYDGPLRLAAFVKTITPSNAVIITVDEAPFIQYYGHRKTIGYPIGHWERLESVFDEITDLMSRNVPVYLILPPQGYLQGGTILKSQFAQVSSQGQAILNEFIAKGLVGDVSSTQVSFQLNNELKEKDMRRIAKGDFDKIWAMLQEAGTQSQRKISRRFKISKAGEVLFEDYHCPELGLKLFMKPVYQFKAFK
jgi:hypothetical protein